MVPMQILMSFYKTNLQLVNLKLLCKINLKYILQKKIKIKTDTLNVWGVCKAGQVFKYYNSKLIAIEKEGNSFLIADYAQKANKRNSQIFVGSVLGGLAGALIATSNKNTAPILTMNISHMSNKQKQPEATLIDMKNGEFSF